MSKRCAKNVGELIELRRKSWKKRGDIAHDARLVSAIAYQILENEHLRNEILQKPYLLIESCFTIIDKRKQSVPFFLNNVQRDFISKIETFGRSKPFFVLKGRQQGFTTLITAIQLSYAITTKNFSGFTIADRDDNTKAIFFDKAKAIYNKLPDILKPDERFNSVNELFFEKLNSSWRVCPASSNVGRSRTLSFIHFSEVAFFRCPLSDLQKSIVEAGVENALIIYETTANGFNEAKALWDSGACHNLFYEWWHTEEYASSEVEYLKNADSWLKNRLLELERQGLSVEQRTWYAKKYCSYIDKSSIKQEYPCSAHEAFISSGECIFDKEALSLLISSFDVKSRLGYFEYDKIAHPVYSSKGELTGCTYSIENIRFIDTGTGFISIVEEPYAKRVGTRLHLKPYVIGADTAGVGKDYFCAKVLDNTSGRVVATVRKQFIDEDLFAEQLYCLGKYYNDALIGVETNFSYQPVRHLRSLGYENLYRSKSLSTFKDENESHFGFITTSVSRPIIIANLVSVMRECPELETDRQTLIEMTTFVRHKDGRHSACDGAHDDLVLSCAIAWYIAIDFEHNMKIIDTEHEILTNYFSSQTQNSNIFMEW
jgi:hypothetical protein